MSWVCEQCAAEYELRFRPIRKDICGECGRVDRVMAAQEDELVEAWARAQHRRKVEAMLRAAHAKRRVCGPD